LLTPGLRTLFFEALAERKDDAYLQIATVIPSDKDQETYPWLGQSPAVREWVDERIPKSMAEQKYTIINKTWENSIEVQRTAIEDDQYGQIKIRVQQLAEKFAMHMNKTVFNLLRDGATGLCYDGQYFFDTDHSDEGSASQDNHDTTALSAASLKAAIAAMKGWVDPQGEYLGINPDTLVVGPDLEWTARELLESAVVVTTTSSPYKNVLQGQLKLIVTPHCQKVGSTDNWFVLDTSGVVKPIILQMRTPVEFQALEADSANGFYRDTYAYGGRARYAAGYGLWQKAYGTFVA
jgi:phage major head subunit gpT-like protein